MPIAALPKDTARLITSTLALNDAASVVKELVDNALDARAGSITIEISSNTLDLIQVRDNGCGIGVEDRQLLCKRGCTSKIRSIEDLAALGGIFLGFRGEALASVLELSSSVTITTRVEGEAVGTSLTFASDGKLTSSSSASHPVGTTVRILDLLSRVPVRQQAALKAGTKTILAIRKLLQAYACARSEVRLSFKVLKAKSEKSNWSFAPSRSGDILSEVAAKVVGNEVTDQCQQCTSAPNGNEEEQQGWRLQLLVISASSGTVYVLHGSITLMIADIHKACNAEQFFSIDKRPVTAERGLMKELSKTYKQYLRSSFASEDKGLSLPRPFLLLRISCPSDSYDVNVEPAKDEVMFYNQNVVKDMFNQLLQNVYGPLDDKPCAKPSQKAASEPENVSAGTFDLLLAKRPNVEHSRASQAQDQTLPGYSSTCLDSVQETATRVEGCISPRPANPALAQKAESSGCSLDPGRGGIDDKSRPHANMYRTNNEDLESEFDEASLVTESEVDEQDVENASVRNPWSLAKLNVRHPTKRIEAKNTERSPAATNAAIEPVHSLGHSYQRLAEQRRPNREVSEELGISSQNPGPPMRGWEARLTESDGDSTSSSSNPLAESTQKTGLEEWIDKSIDIQGERQQPLNQTLNIAGDQTFVHRASTSAPIRHSTKPAQDRQLPEKDTDKRVHQRQRLTLPFKTPFKRNAAGQIESPSSTHQTDSLASCSSTPGMRTIPPNPSDLRRTAESLPAPYSSTRGELEDILEFERQKRILAAQQRKQRANNGTWTKPAASPIPTTQSAASPINDTARYATAFPLRPDSSSTYEGIHEDFTSPFGSNEVPSQQLITRTALPHSNPHRNRYNPALETLSPHRCVSNVHAHPNPGPSANQASREGVACPSEASKMLDTDPRAYLIRFRKERQQEGQAGKYDITNTGLKVKHAKTLRLPLEVVPVSAKVHDIAADVPVFHSTAQEGLDCMRARCQTLAETDEYVRNGRVDTIQWSPLSEEVSEWGAYVKDIVEMQYRPRAFYDAKEPNTQTHLEPGQKFCFEIDLGKALKAFVDEYGA